MKEYLLAEFSILYKRLIIVEITLKELILSKYSKIYNDNAYKVLYRYFKTLDIQRNERTKTFESILNSKKSNFEKLNASIAKMYLREVLLLFSNYVFIKNKVKKDFWAKDVDVKSSEFQKHQKYLKELRNCVAHFNIKKYSLERVKLISSLRYFEELLNCSIGIIDNETMLFVKNSKKLPINTILNIIYKLNKTYFEDDKILIPIFDDIAMLNGYSYQALPKRWSIIRQKYELSGNLKKNDTGEIIINEKQSLQLNLFE